MTTSIDIASQLEIVAATFVKTCEGKEIHSVTSRHNFQTKEIWIKANYVDSHGVSREVKTTSRKYNDQEGKMQMLREASKVVNLIKTALNIEDGM